jgi:hypothetical protein
MLSSRNKVAPIATVLLAMATLGGCSSEATKTMSADGLTCPQVGIIRELAETTFFEGPGRDLTDVAARGQLVDFNGQCTYDREDKRQYVEVELNLTVEGELGPAAQGRLVRLPYFVAVVDADGKILAKQVYDAEIPVPEGQRRQRIVEQLVPTIPLGSERDGMGYRVLVGLQLTDEQRALAAPR